MRCPKEHAEPCPRHDRRAGTHGRTISFVLPPHSTNTHTVAKSKPIPPPQSWKKERKIVASGKNVLPSPCFPDPNLNPSFIYFVPCGSQSQVPATCPLLPSQVTWQSENPKKSIKTRVARSIAIPPPPILHKIYRWPSGTLSENLRRRKRGNKADILVRDKHNLRYYQSLVIVSSLGSHLSISLLLIIAEIHLRLRDLVILRCLCITWPALHRKSVV